MQALASTTSNGLINSPFQRRQLSSILGGVSNLLTGGTSTPTPDQSTGSNPSTGASQPVLPNAKPAGSTQQPAAPNANNANNADKADKANNANNANSADNASNANNANNANGADGANKDASPSTSANPPASSAGPTPATPPALAGSSTTPPASSSNNTDSNKPASNPTTSTAPPDVPAKNATATVDTTPLPASTANATTPNSANLTSTPPELNSTTTSNATVTPLVPLTTSHNSTGFTTPTTNTVTVTDSSRAPVSSASRGPFVSNSSRPQSEDSSSGLSTGAITGIAIIAGVIGFIILFWIGVQMLQSKRKKREEADMQEIDFDPSGGSSVNGDTFSGRGANQHTSPSTGYGSFGQKFNTQDHGDTQYEDDARMCADYVSSTDPPAPNMAGVGGGALNRQPTVGAVSLHSSQSVKHNQGYYGQELTRQPSYSRPTAHGQYAPSYPRFDAGPPMPAYPYEYHNQPGAEVPNYHGDLHNPGYQGAGGMSYGNMVAQSNAPPHPPAAGDFCYPPPNNSPHIAM